MSYLLVGLGNPGREYEKTRHNIGQVVLDLLADELAFPGGWREKFKGLYQSGQWEGDKLYLLKPLTYMNLSGESVQPMAQFFKVPVQKILVLHDELDLPFGTISFKKGGGLAGHNGLKSIAQLLGSQDFLRLRVGIGRPQRGSVSSWVLSGFSMDEQIVVEKFVDNAVDSLRLFLREGFAKAANQTNKRKLI